MEDGDAVCVTGATGYVGSWLVKRLLENGYTVHATVRDPDNLKKVKHLLELLNARTNLTLWKADLSHEGSFDDAINGCTGVFHVARTTNFESQDPENEIFKTTIEGTLNVMRSCLKAETVSRIVFTSSSGACYMQEHEKAEYTEDCWTDVEFCRTKKMTGWMYFVAKTLAEKAAWKFSEEHNLNLITIIPTLVIGPFLTPTMPHSVKTAFSPITRNEALYSMIKQGQSVHIDDLCKAHIFLYEHYEAKGRYICSSHDDTIVDRAKMLKEKFPEFDVQTQFDEIDENLSVVAFSSKKLIDLGFKYRYSLEDMYADAVESCREKGILSQVLARHVEN